MSGASLSGAFVFVVFFSFFFFNVNSVFISKLFRGLSFKGTFPFFGNLVPCVIGISLYLLD